MKNNYEKDTEQTTQNAKQPPKRLNKHTECVLLLRREGGPSGNIVVMVE